MNRIRDILEQSDLSRSVELRDLVYTAARLGGYGPKLIIARFGIRLLDGGKVVAPDDGRFVSLGKMFLSQFDLANLFVRYLAEFARGDGWSGALEDNFAGPSRYSWLILEAAVEGRTRPHTNQFIRVSDVEGYSIEDSASFESPFGWLWAKDAGSDGFFALDSRSDGSPVAYFTPMDSDGAPVGFSGRGEA
jgi:hypothetical protein